MPSTFGTIKGTKRDPEELQNRRLRPYVDYLKELEKQDIGFEAETDPILTSEVEKHVLRFKQAAKTRGYTVTVDQQNAADGTSILYITIGEKRQFSDLTVAKRDRGRTNAQANKAEANARVARAANRLDADQLEAHAQDLRKQTDDLTILAAELQVAEFKKLEGELKTAKENGVTDLTKLVKAAMKAQTDAVALSKLAQEVQAKNGDTAKPPVKAQGSTKK